MSKRAAAAFLWYAMVWVGYEIAWSVAGLPRMLGPVIAASVAMIVVVDPLHLFWPRPDAPAPRSVEAGVHALDAGGASPR
jgi:hypothetical protein